MSRVIVNVSTKKYWKGQDRLVTTLKNNNNAQVLAYRHESDVGALSHKESMYGFKPKAMEKAYELGFRTILWLDASMYVIKNLEPIFNIIERKGYFFQDSGWMNNRWTTPEVKNYFGTDSGKMISSGVLGLDLNSFEGKEFYERWLKAMEDGMFNGSHDDFRHDQSCASLIIENMKLNIAPNNSYWQYGDIIQKPIHEDILIIANGIV